MFHTPILGPDCHVLHTISGSIILLYVPPFTTNTVVAGDRLRFIILWIFRRYSSATDLSSRQQATSIPLARYIWGGGGGGGSL